MASFRVVDVVARAVCSDQAVLFRQGIDTHRIVVNLFVIAVAVHVGTGDCIFQRPEPPFVDVEGPIGIEDAADVAGAFSPPGHFIIGIRFHRIAAVDEVERGVRAPFPVEPYIRIKQFACRPLIIFVCLGRFGDVVGVVGSDIEIACFLAEYQSLVGRELIDIGVGFEPDGERFFTRFRVDDDGPGGYSLRIRRTGYPDHFDRFDIIGRYLAQVYAAVGGDTPADRHVPFGHQASVDCRIDRLHVRVVRNRRTVHNDGGTQAVHVQSPGFGIVSVIVSECPDVHRAGRRKVRVGDDPARQQLHQVGQG